MNKITKFFSKYFIFPRIKSSEVFTPAIAASINYIKRTEIDDLLSSGMSIPGKQIVVFGHSGSGKTSSVLNLLHKKQYKFIRTQCESSTTFNQLILNAFDSLDAYVVSNIAIKKSNSINGNLATEYKKIKASIGHNISYEETNTLSRILPPQLTSQKLANFMGKGNIVWLIEDFHKVSESEKKRIADVLKTFVDNANDYPQSKIICIGACESAYELIKLDPNLSTRVSEISVPLLKDEEIREIITNGFSLLNVTASESLIEKLVYYSDRLVASAHQMCLDICKGENISRKAIKRKQINDDSFKYAVDGFIKSSSDTLKTIYDAAVKNEIGWYILKAFSYNENEKLSFTEISKQINRDRNHYGKEKIEEKLQELMNPPLNIIYYNSNSEKYALSTPFWHRFLRMQFRIEKEEQNKKRRNRNNPNLYFTDDDKYKLVDQYMIDIIMKLKELQKDSGGY